MKRIPLLIALFMITCIARTQEPGKYKADLDSQFNKGSGIASIPLDNRRINDLVVLGKVWGFVKYYHPAVCAGEYNWDSELFRVLPKVMQCNNDKERNEILYTWVKQLGAFKTEKFKQPDSGLIKLQPDLLWINEVAVLGDPLSALLNDIKSAKRTTNNYYVRWGRSGSPDFKNERAYADRGYPDAGLRLLALYRYWNLVQYFFPYKYLIGENWNEMLPAFIPPIVNAPEELAYKQAVLSLIVRIHDSHAGMGALVFEKVLGNNYAPLKIRFIDNKPVVTDYLNKDLGPKTGLQKGDVITSVNGKSIEAIIKEKLPYTSGSNYSTQLRNMAYSLLRAVDTVINITYQRGSTMRSASIGCYKPQLVPWGGMKVDSCFKYVTPDIAYLFPDTMRKDYLNGLLPSLKNTKGMIIDMRSYPPNDVREILSTFLLAEQTPFVRFAFPDLEHPGYFILAKPREVGSRNPDHYKGRVVILVSELTQSAGEFTSMAFRAVPQSTVVGSTTAGADGNVTFFFLPGGIRTQFSGIGVYYPDGRETQRVGIVPDITVQQTIQGIAEGRDEVLEKAIAVINGK
ncbi:hypothetical protein A3860_09885 [Niastella vici]|uniref:Tail specific protease domain-containing protein n=1 Tax=Niastella vici TaxID=1703345 RepID=A0A1V9FEU1_9BACT|nr:S41 family peptidase [Niastella vici]OQP56883.1 hypothetical protein A3860_09885 [Niastella vici]